MYFLTVALFMSCFLFVHFLFCAYADFLSIIIIIIIIAGPSGRAV